MSLELRVARVEDAPAIARLSRDELGYDYPPQLVGQQLGQVLDQEREVVLVACRSDDVVGYVHAEEYRVLYAPVMVNVLGIAVASVVRGQGAGRLLMDGVEQWARTRGASAVRLVSGEQRSGAHAFYARLGYVSSKRQLNFRKRIDG